MKFFRIVGSIILVLAVVASALFPAEAHTLVPASVHDFLVSDGGVLMAAGPVFTGISRKARGLANLGGFKQVILFAEDDFTADWPQQKDIVDGVLSLAPPLKVGVVGAVLKFDINSARGKSNRKGDLGYQTVDADGECKFAGYDAAQLAAIERTFNQGGVAIGVYKDGSRAVFGTVSEPLTFQDSTDSGAKADDKLQIDFKFMGSGYAFHPPLLAPTVAIPLPA